MAATKTFFLTSKWPFNWVLMMVNDQNENEA